MIDDMVKLNGELKHELDYSLLIDFGDKKLEWVPKYLIESKTHLGCLINYEIPKWFAIEKGLI